MKGKKEEKKDSYLSVSKSSLVFEMKGGQADFFVAGVDDIGLIYFVESIIRQSEL
jgi:hypothetical protein